MGARPLFSGSDYPALSRFPPYGLWSRGVTIIRKGAIMDIVLPELKKGDILVKTNADGTEHVVTVIKVGKGQEFDEPVYYLQGLYGAKLKHAYAGEELAELGYEIKQKLEEISDNSGENNNEQNTEV